MVVLDAAALESCTVFASLETRNAERGEPASLASPQSLRPVPSPCFQQVTPSDDPSRAPAVAAFQFSCAASRTPSAIDPQRTPSAWSAVLVAPFDAAFWSLQPLLDPWQVLAPAPAPAPARPLLVSL